jgi:hypothetical protein
VYSDSECVGVDRFGSQDRVVLRNSIVVNICSKPISSSFESNARHPDQLTDTSAEVTTIGAGAPEVDSELGLLGSTAAFPWTNLVSRQVNLASQRSLHD